MPLKEWSISNQQPFTDEVKFAFNCHLNLFIGPNGTGKSTLIRQLWSHLRGQASVIIPANRFPLPRSSDVEGQKALVDDNAQPLQLSDLLANNGQFFDAKRMHHVKNFMAREALQGRQTGEAIEQYLRAGDMAYRCAQMVCGEILTKQLPETYDRKQAVTVTETMASGGGSTRQRARQVGVFHHYYERMAISVTHDVPYNPQGTYEKVFSGDLSDGIQGTLAWIEFMAMHISFRYRFQPGWESRPATLLIDEVENHLHPEWQRRVFPALRHFFPQLQIFATTHSPFLVAGLDAGQVHRLYRDESLTVRSEVPNEEQIMGWTMDEILRGLMGVQDPTDRETALRTEELRRLQNQNPAENLQDEEIRSRRIAELQELVSPEFLSGGVAAADQELFERQFNAALERYRENQGD